MNNIFGSDNTPGKVSKYEIFSGLYFPVFGLWENTDQKKLHIGTLFTQYKSSIASNIQASNRNTRTMCEICAKLTHCSGVSIVDLEQVNAAWDFY